MGDSIFTTNDTFCQWRVHHPASRMKELRHQRLGADLDVLVATGCGRTGFQITGRAQKDMGVRMQESDIDRFRMNHEFSTDESNFVDGVHPGRQKLRILSTPEISGLHNTMPGIPACSGSVSPARASQCGILSEHARQAQGFCSLIYCIESMLYDRHAQASICRYLREFA